MCAEVDFAAADAATIADLHGALNTALAELDTHRAANAALESQLGQAHEARLLAQADAETLRQKIAVALPMISAFRDSYMDAAAEHLEVQLHIEHPGTPLADEVAAARAVIQAAHAVVACARTWIDWPAMSAAIAAYDAAVKAGSK